jgi:hypothetical protein
MEDPREFTWELVEIEAAVALCWLIVFDPVAEFGLVALDGLVAESAPKVLLLKIVSEL